MEQSTRVLVGLYGVISIAFGTLMYVQPVGGAVALVALIAAFAIVTGSTLIAISIEVRREGPTALSSVLPTSAEREVHAQALVILGPHGAESRPPAPCGHHDR